MHDDTWLLAAISISLHILFAFVVTFGGLQSYLDGRSIRVDLRVAKSAFEIMTGLALGMLACDAPGSLLVLSFGLAMSIGADAIYEGHLASCLVLKRDMNVRWSFVSCTCLALLGTFGLASICDPKDALLPPDPFTFLWLALLCLLVAIASISAVSTSVHLRRDDSIPHRQYTICRLLFIPLIDIAAVALLLLSTFLHDPSLWCGIAVVIGIQAVLSIGEPEILFSDLAPEYPLSPSAPTP